MKGKVYIETTIVSYLAARPSRDLVAAAHQQITREWWEGRKESFDLYVSRFVLDEAAAGDRIISARRLQLLEGVPVLALTGEIMDLAEELVQSGALPRKAAIDALHIATATVYGCD